MALDGPSIANKRTPAAPRPATALRQMDLLSSNPGSAVRSRIKLMIKKVRYVPAVGIIRRTVKNVPKKEPKVEIAETRPEILPVTAVSAIISFRANGITMPRMVTGKL